MKKTISLLLINMCTIHLLAQQSKNDQFTLTGKVINNNKSKIYLGYPDKYGKRIKDSSDLKDGNFFFRGTINEPTRAFITGYAYPVNDTDINFVELFLEPTSMTALLIQDRFKAMDLTGSQTHLESMELGKQTSGIDFHQPDAAKQFSAVYRRFVRDHPDSYISAEKLSGYKTNWPIAEVTELYNSLTPAIKNTANARSVKTMIDDLEAAAEGKMAKDFLGKDLKGDALRLSQFKGKYVIIDFWGSWCVPCRESTPHLISLYNKYKEKGLEVIAIAQEYEPTDSAWREAIKKDGTAIWYNILNDKIDPMTKKYAVQAYPTKVLINKDGKIIGRYIGTESADALDKKMAEIF
ncbi:MAG: TlpA disulfide reductase family protein [Bacteroidota bacterium]